MDHTEHPSDEILECYALGRLPEADTAPLEEHLLICHLCQDKLRTIDRLIAGLRDALGDDKDKTG